MNWWLPLHPLHGKRVRLRCEERWGESERSDRAHHWVTVTYTEEESSSSWWIFKSSSRDKNVKAITHPVCPPWFMEWDRNWLTERRDTPRPPFNNTHTGLCPRLLYTEQAADWALWTCSTSQQKACCLPLSCSLFLSPSSVSLACLFKCVEKWKPPINGGKYNKYNKSGKGEGKFKRMVSQRKRH